MRLTFVVALLINQSQAISQYQGVVKHRLNTNQYVQFVDEPSDSEEQELEMSEALKSGES